MAWVENKAPSSPSKLSRAAAVDNASRHKRHACSPAFVFVWLITLASATAMATERKPLTAANDAAAWLVLTDPSFPGTPPRLAANAASAVTTSLAKTTSVSVWVVSTLTSTPTAAPMTRPVASAMASTQPSLSAADATVSSLSLANCTSDRKPARKPASSCCASGVSEASDVEFSFPKLETHKPADAAASLRAMRDELWANATSNCV